MGDGVFVRGPGEELIPVTREDWRKEDDFQRLVVECPDLLSGDGESRAWLLVRREAGIPHVADAADRWSVDHLFLDAEGIPTLVEVKRRGDTRLRREVVGQMLDYAANAAAYWTAEAIQERYERTCEDAGFDSEQHLLETFVNVVDTEDYWQSVRTNLDAGRLRLIFLADAISAELRAIVEFLNRQMSPAIVQAVEVSQYTGPDGESQTLLAKLIGDTEAAKRTKTTRSSRTWDKKSWFERLAEEGHSDWVKAAERLFAWAETHQPPIPVKYNRGATTTTAKFGRDDASAPTFPFHLFNAGSISIPLGRMARGTHHAFRPEQARRELINRYNNIPGFQIDPERNDRGVDISMAAIADDAACKEFIEVVEWALKKADY